MPRCLILIFLSLVGVLSAFQSSSQLAAQANPTPESGSGTFSVRMVQASAPPVIDGKLDEAVWEKAAVITNFTQVRPIENVAPTEKTEVRLLQDSDFLYVGIRAYDSEPDKLIAKEMQRDASLRSEDRLSFAIPVHISYRDTIAPGLLNDLQVG
ncbi:hypothetical protein F7C95_04610 [Opitutia bacterium ISCC 51]|nr:hypothetical protein F7C95_04610 [Opitutae bacterium ISCC 51]